MRASDYAQMQRGMAEILNGLPNKFDTPEQAIFALACAIAYLANSLDMDEESISPIIRAAFEDLQGTIH